MTSWPQGEAAEKASVKRCMLIITCKC